MRPTLGRERVGDCKEGEIDGVGLEFQMVCCGRERGCGLEKELGRLFVWVGPNISALVKRPNQ